MKENELYYIIYFSRAIEKLERIQIVDICAAAAAKNAKLDITGILLCVGNSFLQILEGPKSAVTSLYKQKISKDPRHSQCQILAEGPLDKRSFSQWGMNFVQMDDAYFLKMEELSELRAYVERLLKSPDMREERILKLLQRIPGILKAHKIDLDILSPGTLSRGKA